MKQCSKCKDTKPLSDFNSKGDRRASYCKPCLYRYQMDRWIARKVWAVEYKGGICEDCLQSFPMCVFDFHHLDPSVKDMDWNKMRLVSKQRLTEELDKCVLLCSNCHRIRHWA